jgi:hypothetical protein
MKPSRKRNAAGVVVDVAVTGAEEAVAAAAVAEGAVEVATAEAVVVAAAAIAAAEAIAVIAGNVNISATSSGGVIYPAPPVFPRAPLALFLHAEFSRHSLLCLPQQIAT